jgi:hypothetical protein
MTRRALPTIAWLALVLQVVGGAWSLDRMLCVGSDGHVALELAHPGACSVEARRHHHELEHEIAAGCDDHGCTDIMLSTASARPESGQQLAVTPVAIVRTLPPIAPVTRRSWLQAVPVSDTSHHARQSIVLLI